MTQTARAPRAKLSITRTTCPTTMSADAAPAAPRRSGPPPAATPAPAGPDRNADVSLYLDPVRSHFGMDDAEADGLAAFARKLLEGPTARRTGRHLHIVG